MTLSTGFAWGCFTSRNQWSCYFTSPFKNRTVLNLNKTSSHLGRNGTARGKPFRFAASSNWWIMEKTQWVSGVDTASTEKLNDTVDGSEIRLSSWYVKHPIIYRVLCIPSGAGFFLSTVFWEMFFFFDSEKYVHFNINMRQKSSSC